MREDRRKDGGTRDRCFEVRPQKWLTHPGGCNVVIWSHLVTKDAGSVVDSQVDSPKCNVDERDRWGIDSLYPSDVGLGV